MRKYKVITIEEERYIEKNKLYIDNVVTTLNLINAELKDFEVSKLFSSIYNPKIDAEFMADEIDNINKYIRENDVDSIIHLFESKVAMSQEVFKDMVYSKTDSILRVVVDNVTNIHQPMDIYLLSDYEQIAVVSERFDFKIKHEGLTKWVEGADNNFTGLDIDCLYDFVDESTFEDKDKLLEILGGIAKVKRSIDNLNYSSPWYDKDKETRLNSLKNYEQQYLNIEKNWIEYVE